MKRLLIILIYLTPALAFAQITLPPDGNKKASVSEDIGITRVKVEYSRPAVNGREGKIWGQLVHEGFADLHYGTSKAAPWRAGANENTTVEFSTDVLIEDKALPAGKYGFFIAMGKEKATLVFSKFSNAWGSFYYDPKDDVLRVEVPVQQVSQSIERLKYEFDEQTKNSAVLSMQWEKVKVPFKISVDLEKTIVAAFQKEFNSGIFYRYWQNMQMAANYCLVNNINLEQALGWADRSVNTYFGEANFQTLTTYAGLLEKFDRKTEADSLIKKAMPMGSALQFLIYGDGLIKMKEQKKALETFQYAIAKYPTNDYALRGIIMGYYHNGNKAEALKQAEKAIKISKDKGWQNYFTTLANDLKAGKEI